MVFSMSTGLLQRPNMNEAYKGTKSSTKVTMFSSALEKKYSSMRFENMPKGTEGSEEHVGLHQNGDGMLFCDHER